MRVVRQRGYANAAYEAHRVTRGRKRLSSDQRPERPSQSRGHRIIATLASAASFEIGTGDCLSKGGSAIMLRVSSSAPIDEREHRFRHEFSLVSYITLDFALLLFLNASMSDLGDGWGCLT